MVETTPPNSAASSPPRAEKAAQHGADARGTRFEPPAGSVLRLPAGCANCGQLAGASTRLAPPWGVKGRAILVPQCARCARRFEQWKTRQAVGLGISVLLGLGLLLGLPLAQIPLGMFGYGVLVTFGATLPLVLVWLVDRRRVAEPDQTSAEVALWWDRNGITGTNREWITELAILNSAKEDVERTTNGSVPTAAPSGVTPSVAGDLGPAPTPPIAEVSPRPLSLQRLVLPVTFAAISPSVYQWLFPTLVVLNLSPTEFELVVDGATRGVVGVTSLESTSAATRLSLGAGHHVLEARPRGESLEDVAQTYRVNVSLQPGEEYLFAPGSDGHCFWLERTVYGRADGKARKQPLGGKDGFFRLPSSIDTWFAANPEPNADRVSTGGEMVALRQGRCQ